MNDPAFHAELGAGSSFSIVDREALAAAISTNGFLDLSFQPQPGTVPVVRFLLPMERIGDSFALVQQLSNGTVISSPLNLSDNVMDLNTATSYGRGSATYDPALPFWAMDLTTQELAPQNAVDLRAVTWTQDASQYPLRSVAIWFDHTEAGHRFTVHSRLGDGPEMRASGPTVYASSSTHPVLDVAVGEGMAFWVTREADGRSSLTTTSSPCVASNAGMQSLAGDGDGWSALGMFPDPPQRGPMEMKHFRVHYQNRYSHSFSVRMSDGYATSISPSPSYSTESVASWDDQGVPDPSPLQVVVFDAQIDPTRAWWLRDEDTGEDFPIGQTDVFDGWTPLHANPPPLPTITLRLPVWRTDTSMMLDASGGQPGVQFSPSEGAPSQDTLAGVNGLPNYPIDTVTTTLTNPRPYEGGAFTLGIQNSSGDSIAVYAGENDLRLWLPPPQSISLNISTSRSGHRLILRHPNGHSYPIMEGITQGTYSGAGGVSYLLLRGQRQPPSRAAVVCRGSRNRGTHWRKSH